MKWFKTNPFIYFGTITIASLALLNWLESHDYANNLVASEALKEAPEVSQGRYPRNYVIQENTHQSREKLPEHIAIIKGALSMFADFSTATYPNIDIYIINDSQDDVIIPTDEEYPMLKLEGQDFWGTWFRAQSNQIQSHCYWGPMYRTLPPNSYVKIKAPYYSSGKQTTTRYKLYNESHKDENFVTDAIINLTSNEGKGCIIPSVAARNNL